MANRPPFLCELDKNKLIDTQVGFVDTFNWAVRAIDNLEGTGKVKVDWTLDDHPTITLKTDDGDAPDNNIQLGNIQFTGTDGTDSALSNAFTFQSLSDSNVVVNCDDTNINIGVYYV